VRRRKAEGNPVRLVRQDVRPHQSGPKAALSRIGRARIVTLLDKIRNTGHGIRREFSAALETHLDAIS
ncbi:hypothetical protein, partial [Bradyrhizobium liaoningense]|uniref:hypothetical protein n=1 Tax=Bradyrhizobium liaoningense TaxID=43992 RepID=UPI0024E061D8